MSTTLLQGRIAVITGASAGIGEAVAHSFAAGGASLVLNARRREKLEALASKLPGSVGHVFTHFPLELVVFRAETQAEAPEGCRWLPKREIPGAAFPTVFRKVLAHASTEGS